MPGPDGLDSAANPSNNPARRERSAGISRRNALKTAAASVGSVVVSMSAMSGPAFPSTTRGRTEPNKPVHLAKERLNELAAKFYPDFNERNILAPISEED
jgi:hypothetical protein